MDKIFGNLIFLRPITSEDTNFIVKWRNTDFVRENFIFREKFTKEMHENWIKTQINTGKVIQYIICDNLETPIGSIYFRDIDVEKREAEFGIFIGEKNFIGKGLGQEATKLFINFGFKELGFDRIILRVIDTNNKAEHIYEKVGFKKIDEIVQIVEPSKDEVRVIIMEIKND